jgi:hypothetical protein
VDLSTILADAFEEARTLEANAAGFSPERARQILNGVKAATEDYTKRLNLADAMLKSGLSERTMRRRHRELVECELAGFDDQHRMWFAAVAVPPRADVAEQRARGRQAAGE